MYSASTNSGIYERENFALREKHVWPQELASALVLLFKVRRSGRSMVKARAWPELTTQRL